MLIRVPRFFDAALSSLCVPVVAAAIASCRPGPSKTAGSRAPQDGSAPTMSSGEVALPPDDGQWMRPAKDYASTRFSGLTEINTANVKNLRAVVTFSTGVLKGHEAAPIVAGNTMFIITPFPNIVYALDLTKPGYPTKWSFKPKPASGSQGEACCDVVNRGVVYDNGKIFFNTLDDHTYCLDAASGKVVWVTQVGDIERGETITMAPLVVKDRVLVGNSGGEYGVRGWLRALDTRTGTIVWTAYATGPDKDVLIGSSFHAPYAQDRGRDLGVSSWPSDMWKIGGGTMWGWISYDPDLDLIFYGTANPGPWDATVRPGDNKWTSAVFARRPETGEAVWAYQMTPHDSHDYDGVNEQIIATIPWQGQQRKVLIRPDRNGYMYVMDPATGQLLSAEPYGFINTTTGVDLQTGQLGRNPAKQPKLGQVVREMCPGAPGVKDWQPSAYSPRTGMLYVPHQNLCMDEELLSSNYIAGTPYVGAVLKQYAGPGGYRGEFMAWNPQTGRKVWGIPEDFPVWSGALVTAGDVAFYGTMDGWFKAVDARTGALLWKYKTGSGIVGQPISYRGPDGHQYVAVLAGVGGWAGAIVSGDLDPSDSSAGGGFANAVKDLPQKTTKGGMLYVFAL